MPRQRMTEEEAIEKYGSIERYLKHLNNVRRYVEKNKEKLKLYREKHLQDAIDRAKKWREEHRDRYNERQRNLNHAKYHTDPLYRKFIRARCRANTVLEKIGIKRKDFLILHSFGPLGDTFMYLHRDEHCAIRRSIIDKKKCYFDVILENPELISSAYVIEDGKLAMILKGTRKSNIELMWKGEQKKEVVTCKTMLKHCRNGLSFAHKQTLEAEKAGSTNKNMGDEH